MQGIDNWEYARFVTVVGRSFRLNPPTGLELTAATNFITATLALRAWLLPKRDRLISPTGNLTPKNYEGKMIEAIGRDMNKIAILNATERDACNTLFAATGIRKYGDKSNTIAADVTHPS